MVRFARADGSKGSNKRQLEEPTPWTEMVSQLGSNKKKRKKNQEVESGKNDGALGQATKKKENIGTGEHPTKPENLKTVEKKDENHPMQNTAKKNKKEKKKGAKTSEPEYTITPEGKRVKVFRDGTARTWFDLPYEESDAMTRYEGMWVKKMMVQELDRLKATIEEEGYDKKEMMRKMMKAKRKAHRELRIELIYQQKGLVSEATGDKGKDVSTGTSVKENSNNTKSTKKKKKQKPFTVGNGGSRSFLNTENRMETNPSEYSLLDEKSAEEIVNTEEEQIDDNNVGDGKDDTKVIVTSPACGRVQMEWKTNYSDGKIKKKNRTEAGGSEVLPSQVNGRDDEGGQDNKNILVTQDDYKVKKKKKSKKDSLEPEIISSQSNREDNSGDDMEVKVTPQADGKTKKKKKMKEDELETEVAKPQTDIEYNNEVGKGESIESFANNKEEIHDGDFKKIDHTSSSREGFEENELMTNYDGYWVLRKEVESLEAAKKMELEAILYAAGTDGSDENKGELTQEEQLILQRAMKKRKRFHHRRLLQRLSKMGTTVDGDGKGRSGGRKEDSSGKVVQFDGFWVKKDAADRLHKLRKKLCKEGLSQQEVDALIQKERRKEERVLKNERKLVCLNCRQPGHMVSACPKIVQAEGEGQPSICYTCGSTEHTSSTCNMKKGSEQSFSFATCYICGETGHISRQCPDNPRGLYPKGGACRGCGSVEHLAKDCPDLQKEKVESSITVGRLKGEELEALDDNADGATDQDVSPTHKKRDRPKVVKF